MEYGFLSLVPPLLTIVLALVTKNVFISLLVGIMTGSFVVNAFAPLTSINAGLYAIVDSMSQGNTIVIGSILMIGAVIHLIEKSGGIEGFVNVVVKNKGIIKTKRGANLFTWILGLAVFTSGSLSCMVTGAVSRPVNDSMKVPHEKSAFLVHTTSTPWCVLFPFSGWLASMAGYLVSGGVPEGESVSMLFSSIGLNFYCILSIVMVLVLALLQKDGKPIMDPVPLNLRDTVYPPDETGFVIASYTADGAVSYRHYDYAGNATDYVGVTAFNGFSEGLAAVTLADGRLVYINQLAEIVIQ